MKRRTFLASAGIGLATAVAGCTSQATSNGSPETSSDTTTTPSESAQTETEQTPESTLITAGNTIERTIGNGSLEERGLRKPHHVAFGNPTKKAYQGTIIVSKAGETVFEESVELEANANIIVTLTDLDTYTTRVTVPELEATEEVSIDPSQFTCNVTKTTVSIQKSGALDSVGVSTLMACPGVVSENVGTRESASETLDADLDSGDEKAGSHTLILRNPSEKTWTTRILI